MKDKALKLYEHSFVRYVIVGGLSYVIELSLLLSLVYAASLSAPVGVAISFWVGLIVSFILQRIIAFRDKRSGRKLLAGQIVAYGALVAVNYAFTIGFVYIAEPLVGVVVSRTVALVITTLWNFLIYRNLIFKGAAQ